MNIIQFIKNLFYTFDNTLYARRFSDINPNVIIPKSTIFAHRGMGVVIGSKVKLGENVFIGQYVTLGARHKEEFPTIEDDVVLHAYSRVIGNVTVGKGSIIGMGVEVLKDVPPNTIIHEIVWK